MAWLTDRRLLAAALAVWCLLALIGLTVGHVLGHDESAFALTARGEQPDGSWLYRSDGTVWIAQIGAALGRAAWQVRLPSAVVNVGAIVATYAVGRAAFDARTGAWAAAVLAGTHPMGLRAAELLSDLPAMACVLGGVAVLVAELEPTTIGPDRRPSWRLLAAAPLFAASFYVRYGSAPIVAFAIAVAAAMWWRSVVRRPWPLVGMLALLGVLIVPHLVRSHEATGEWFGILEVSRGMPRREYIGEGLVTYVTSNPLTFYGFLAAPVMIAGLVGLASTRRRSAWYLAILALGQIVSLGLQSHGQPRYVFVATALLIVLGVDYLRRRWPRPRIALGLVAAAWLGTVIAAVVTQRHLDDMYAPIVDAGEAIRARSGGRPCAVVASAVVPPVMWYSGCTGYLAKLETPMPADRDRYAISFQRWPMDVAAFAAAQHLTAEPVSTGDERAHIFVLR